MVRLLWIFILILFSVGCSKNILAGKSSEIQKGHLISAPLTFALTSVAPADQSAIVTFPAVTNATLFTVYYKLSSATTWTQGVSGATSPLTQTGLTNGATYDVKLAASNISGSADSNTLQVIPNTLPDPFLMTSLAAGDSQLFVTFPTTTGVGPITYTVRYGTSPGVYPTTVSTNAISPLTINGLTNGVTYYVRVFAVNYVGETATLNEFSAIPSNLPSIPVGLAFTGSTGTTCVFNWTASVGIPPIVYSVKQAFAPASAATAGTPIGSCTVISGTSCTVSGLTAGVDYNFSVSSSNGSGSAGPSADAMCSPVQNTFNLTSAIATSSSTVNVVYPTAVGATSYTTKYSTVSGGASAGVTGCSAIAGTTCSITGLNPTTTYYFITTANSASSSVTASAEMSATTPSVASTPLGFTSIGSTGTTCLFNWVASTGTPTITYTVKRSTSPLTSDSTGTAVTGCTAISGVTTCSDTAMIAGTTYYYSMRATNGGGSSAATSEVSCQGIQNPFTLTSVTQSNSKLTLVWPSMTGATAYTVKYGTTSGSYPFTVSTNAVSPFQITGLANGTTYYVMVTATNSTNTTQNLSSQGTGTPSNSPPVANNITPASFSEDASSTITLSYTDLEGDSPFACTTSGLTNVTLSSGCSCSAGVCTVGVIGTSNYNGAASFNFQLFDIGGASNTATATLTINPVNDAPAIATISSQSTAEDTPSVVNFSVSDVDSILLCTSANLTATSSNTGLVANSAIVIGGTFPNCSATITPVLNQNGTTNISITLNDNGAPNLSDVKTFALTVTPVNDPPSISTITAQSTNEDTPSSAITFTVTDVDSALTCAGSVSATSGNTAIIANTGLVIGGTAPNCTITVTPLANQNGGPVVITVSATDGVAAPATTTFNMTIVAVDDPPTITSIANQTINEDTPTTALAFTIADIDSTLSCATSITKGTSNSTIIPAGNIVIGGTAPNCTATITPAADQNGGPVTITLGVTDGTTTTNTTFTVSITSILDITSVTLPANGIYVQDQNLDFTVNFEGAVTVSGTPKLALTVGAAARTANYVSGSGTSALLFRYTPTNVSVTDDYDSDGITFSSTTLTLTGATIVDASSGLAVTPTFTPGLMTGILVDARTYSYSIAVSSNNVNENVGAVTATLTLSQAPQIDLTFPLTISGTATLGSDYTTTLGATMTVFAGTTTATGTITVIDDALLEDSESVILSLAEPSTRTQYIGAAAVALLSINANDAPNYPIQMGQSAFSTCAINQLGKLYCTGGNSFGSLGVGDLDYRTSFTAVDSANNYSLLGTGSAGSSSFSNCGITTGGVLKCWGYNGYGGVGDGTTTNRPTPVIIDGGVSYSKVSNGYHGACGITVAGVLKCWGYNNYKQVGDGTTTNQLSPIVIDGGTNYSQVSRGIYSTCAITTAGVLKCWGYNAYGTVGDNTTTDVISPQVIDSGTTYASLTNSLSYTMCATTTGNVLKCWGLGTNGQIGNGAASTRLIPTIVDSGVQYSSVANSTLTTCGITTGGVLKCWGGDRAYNIGLSVNTNYTSPQVIHTGETFTQVILNDMRVCALNSLNAMKCAGQRGMGLMADGQISQYHSLKAISGLDIFTSLSMNGQYGSAGIKSDSTLWTWGFGRTNSDGFGDASSQDLASSAIQVTAKNAAATVISTFLKVSKGYKHTCAIGTDQKLYCWGINTNGNIGDGTTTTRLFPVAVDSATNYTQISAGTFFTCGITSTSVLKCWGLNTNNSVGDNSTTQRNSPTIINSGTTYKSLAVAAGNTMCAITTADVLKCWGYNNYGQVGIGGTTNQATPSVVDSGVTYASVVASISHTCGLTLATNQIKCWGQNSSYQLGDATTTDRQIPVVFNSGTTYSDVGLNGSGLTCGITSAGSALHCAGLRSAGLAANSTEDGFGQSASISIVDAGTSYTNLYSGYGSICGRTGSAVTKCAGDGIYGAFLGETNLLFTTGLQYGTGSAANTLTPIGSLP